MTGTSPVMTFKEMEGTYDSRNRAGTVLAALRFTLAAPKGIGDADA
jgi:hypothetical protein